MPNGWPTITIDLNGAASLVDQELTIEMTEVTQAVRLISIEKASASGEVKMNRAKFEAASSTEKVGQLKMIEIGREAPPGGLGLLFQAEIYVEGKPTKVAVFR